VQERDAGRPGGGGGGGAGVGEEEGGGEVGQGGEVRG